MATTRDARGPAAYGVVSRALHWLTVVVLVAQFVVGWTMSDDAYDVGADRAEQRLDAFEDRGEAAAERQGETAEERFEREVQRREAALEPGEDDGVPEALVDVVTLRGVGDGLSAPEVHVLLGLLVLGIGVVRLVRRRIVPLPPWAEHLSARERVLEGALEKALLTLLLVVPLTGLALALGTDDLLVLHVAAQVALLLVVSVHVGLVLRHTVVHRNRHLSRML